MFKRRLYLNEVLKVIKRRRSTRAFKPEQIKQEELDRILEAAIYAPSGHNTQPWHFTVIQNRGTLDHINEMSKQVMRGMEVDWIKKAGMNAEYDITYKAPTLIIVSGRKDAISWKTDCDAAIENMLLAAESLGVGAVWMGFATFGLRNPDEAAKIGIPEGYEPHYGVAMGYRLSETASPAPKRNTDVVNYIR
jgi:nitroreductase